MEFEDLNSKGITVTGASADLTKAFDEIQRELLYTLLRKGGFPERVLRAYVNFQENLLVYNAVGQGLGLPYHRPCSIPQGCPLSMAFMAFIMRPWVMKMNHLGAKPRVLADDIMVSIAGAGSFDRFVPIFNDTLQYCKDLGARVAPDKSFTFSTDKKVRKQNRTLLGAHRCGA